MMSLTQIFSGYERTERRGDAGTRVWKPVLNRNLVESGDLFTAESAFKRADFTPGVLELTWDDGGRTARFAMKGWRHIRVMAVDAALWRDPPGAHPRVPFAHPYFVVKGHAERRGDYVVAWDVEAARDLHEGKKKKKRELSDWFEPKSKKFARMAYHVPSGYVFLPALNTALDDVLEPILDKWRLLPSVTISKE